MRGLAAAATTATATAIMLTTFLLIDVSHAWQLVQPASYRYCGASCNKLTGSRSTGTGRSRSILTLFEKENDTSETFLEEKAPLDSSSVPKSTQQSPVPKQVMQLQQRVKPPPPPTSRQMMRALDTSPRRIFVSVSSAAVIALGANFLGVTSKLLEAVVPEATVEASGLDTFYPVGGYKRVRSYMNSYSFVIPSQWLADTTVELAKAQRRSGALDYNMQQRSSSSGGGGNIPDAAYGPPGRLDKRGVSKGDTNVSVLVSNVPGFSLRGTLGTPTRAAETLLAVSLAPPGSGRTATLVQAVEDVDRHVYQFEYTVDRGERPPLRAISVIAARNGDTLLTLTVVAPDSEWVGKYETQLRKVASSFHLR